jgi:DNA primase
MRRRTELEVPKPPIAAVLAELTGCDPEDIPTGYGWVRMRCPFHEDRTPSAAVNHEVDGFRCHSCDRSGDALKLLQTERRIDFKEAAEIARALGGETTTKTTKRKRRASDLL